MKRMLMAAMMVMVCGLARAQQLMPVSAPQVKDDLFAGTEKFAAGASDVTELNLDPNMLAMVSNGNAEMVKKMDFVVVHSYDYDKPGMYNADDVEVFRKKLTDGSWSCFLHVSEAKSGEKTDMCVRQGADHETNELVLLAAEPKELTFIHIKGRMSLSDLEKMNAMTRMTANMARHGMSLGTMSAMPFYGTPRLSDVPRPARTPRSPNAPNTPPQPATAPAAAAAPAVQ